MKEQDHCMLGLCPATSENGAIVSIAVNPTHPLLQLKRALPWEALTEVMTRHWRQHGKNVDGGPGLPWDVSLYVPLVVLMLIKDFDSREMEAYRGRECGGACVHWSSARYQGADSRPLQHRSGLLRPWARRGRRGQSPW